MNGPEYWQRRMTELQISVFNDTDAYEQRLRREYIRAALLIHRDLRVFYQRYATNEGISMFEARKQLRGLELSEFKLTLEEFIAMAKDNLDGRWTKELNSIYYRSRVSRLDALLTQVRHQIEMLTDSRQKSVKQHLGNQYKDTYYRTIYEIQTGMGIGTSFARVDTKEVEMVLQTPLAGENFSSRIWRDRDKLVYELQTRLSQAIIRGESPATSIQIVSDRMNVSFSNAARLVQTESAFFTGQARLEGYRESGVNEYEIVATLDTKTSEICRGMDGRVFQVSEAKVGVNYWPFHARCRTTDAPYFGADEFGPDMRAARDENGKYILVPADMKYPEWKKKYVDNANNEVKVSDSYQKNPVIPKNETFHLRDWSLPIFTSNVNQSINKVAKEAVRRCSGTTNERGYFIDAKNGKIVLSEISGKKSSISLAPIEKDLMKLPAKSVIMVHNHPRGGSFSPEDILTCDSFSTLKGMYVAGHNGVKYYLEFKNDSMKIDRRDFESEYYGILNIFLQNESLIDATHKTMLVLKEKYKWIYEREVAEKNE